MVRIEGAATTPPADVWPRVTGSYVVDDDAPTLAATTVEEIPPPVDPYE